MIFLPTLVAGTDAMPAKTLERPFLAALRVVGIGALGLSAAGLVPGWGRIGGILSALPLASQLFVAEAIGAGPFLVVVTGTVASLLIDDDRLVDFEAREIDAWRIAMGALMRLGVLLVALF